ncbi:hypothetical protein F5Y16DRAFT_398149 [Xylariaceae sp. FL0255]|nr:hypothetical protein F5Y16DRAFT_398149 [Xylariaceae sp. FL0255]
MPQTMYLRPWPDWLWLAITLPLVVLWVVLIWTLGANTGPALLSGFLYLIVLGIFVLLDPETTTYTRKTLEDGTTVTVRRPLFGFKKYESLVGLTGGYEVRVDGYRYERAYIRI